MSEATMKQTFAHTAISIVVFVIPPVVVALVFLCNTAIRARYHRQLRASNRMRAQELPEEAASLTLRPELSEARLEDGVKSWSWSTLQPIAVTVRRWMVDGEQERASTRAADSHSTADNRAETSAPRFRLWRRNATSSNIIPTTTNDTFSNAETVLVATFILLPKAPNTARIAGARTELALGVAHAMIKPETTCTQAP